MPLPDLAPLIADLLQFRSGGEDAAAHREVVQAAVPRCVAILKMLPAAGDGDLLELGAHPYLLTLCLRRVWAGALTLANYHGTAERRGRQRLVHQQTGEEMSFEYDLFNVEEDEFPYPDSSFDVVIFSELVEHLALNPVWALSEMHRVLRPEGHLIVSTPNAVSVDRLITLLRGGSQMVDKYVPVYGYGARHNRECTPGELRELLEETGFAVEEMVVRDLALHSPLARGIRTLAKGALRLFSQEARSEHIFLRARRRPRFRWYFPPRLFDHMHLYHLVRHSYVEMGVNDAIQCIEGWGPLENATGGPSRAVIGCAKVFVKAPESTGRVGVELRGPGDVPGAEARIIVRDRFVGTLSEFGGAYLEQTIAFEGKQWHVSEFVLPRRPRAGDEVEVLIEAPAGTAVRRVWLDSDNAN
jgi:SAM-dependent methyltransferase